MDTHGMKFVVDTTGVAKGLRDYRSAVDGIFTSLDKFEKHVNQTMQGVAKASANPQAINSFKKAVQAFSNVDIDTSAAKKLSALSAAMNGFKAPSESQAQNTKKFFTTLGNMPDLTTAFRSVKALSNLKTAMEGFKAPPTTQAANLAAFGKAAMAAVPGLQSLSKIAGISGVANELASISIAMRNLKPPTASQVTNLGNMALALKHFNLTNLNNAGGLMTSLGAISNFRAPSAAQIRNLENFVNAIDRMKPPANAAAISSSMMQIANAASYANERLGGLRVGMPALGGSMRSMSAEAKGASLNMMGLQNAFSGTFQAGSVLRSLLGSLTLGELGREFFHATQVMNQFEASMSILSDDKGFQEDMWKKVSAAANHFGADLGTMAEAYGKFALAAKESGATVQQSWQIFTGFQTVETALHLGTEQQQSVGLALREMMDRGYVSTQQLTRQLGMVLPGAVATLQAAVKEATHGTGNLWTELKKKHVDSTQALLILAEHYRNTYGPAVKQALESPIQQFAILKNNLMQFMVEVGNAGAKKGFADLIAKISGNMNPELTKKYADALGKYLTREIDKLSNAVDFLSKHWDQIKGPLGTATKLLGEWMLISTLLKIGSYITLPLRGATTAFLFAKTAIWDTVFATRALAATNLTSFYANLAKIGSAETVAGVMKLQTSFGALQTSLGAGGAFEGVGTAIAAIGTGLAAAGTAALGLGVAFASGAKAAHDSGVQLASDQYTTAEIVRGAWSYTMSWLGSVWDKTTTGIGQLWSGYLLPSIKSVLSVIGTIVSNTAIGVAYAFDTAVRGISDLFVGLAQGVIKTMSSIGDAANKLAHGDIAGAKAAGLAAITGKSFSDGMRDAFKDIHSYADFKKNVGIGFKAAIDDPLAAAGARGRSLAQQGKPKPKPTAKPADDLLKPDLTKLLQNHGEAGKKKKGRKEKSLEDKEKEVENTVDDLMKKLDAADPIGKLYNDFVSNLTKEAHVLLDNKGYQVFLKNIQGDAGNAEAQVQDLIDTLEKGGNLDKKTMADLKKRYGEDVNGVIEQLKAQVQAYNAAIKGATVKKVDSLFKDFKDGIAAFGDASPKVKLFSETLSKLRPIAETALNKTAFGEWYKEIHDGSTDAVGATNNLAIAIESMTGTSPGLQKFFKDTGLNAQTAAAYIRGLGAELQQAQHEAERSNQFGGDTLHSMDQDLIKGGLSGRGAEVYDKLTVAVREYNKAHQLDGKITKETVAGLQEEIIKRIELSEQLKRNMEFFQNNGVRGYINDLKDAGTAAHELDKNVLQSLEDQLFNLGTTGKFSFKAIFDTIQQGIVRFSSQQIMKSLMGGIFGKDALENGDPGFAGAMFKAIGIGDGTKPGTKGPLGSSSLRGMTAAMPVFVQDIGVNKFSGDLYSGAPGYGETQLLDGIAGTATPSLGNSSLTASGAAGMRPANDNSATATSALLNGPTSVVAQTATKTASSFGSVMQGMMPMIGMAFASTFKSPIAQIGAMFASMMLSKMLMGGGGGGGGGGIGGLIGKLLGGGGGGGGLDLAGLASSTSSAIDAIPIAAFREGGYSNSPVSRAYVHPSKFINAPHYAEGTSNTSGMPAILHPNEAVIPLSRGRKIPIEGGMGQQIINNNFNVQSPDADSFRKSRGQIATELHMQAGRAFSRNHR